MTDKLRRHMAVEARRDGGARVFFDPALQPDRDEALRIERAPSATLRHRPLLNDRNSASACEVFTNRCLALGQTTCHSCAR